MIQGTEEWREQNTDRIQATIIRKMWKTYSGKEWGLFTCSPIRQTAYHPEIVKSLAIWSGTEIQTPNVAGAWIWDLLATQRVLNLLLASHYTQAVIVLHTIIGFSQITNIAKQSVDSKNTHKVDENECIERSRCMKIEALSLDYYGSNTTSQMIAI